MSEQHPVKTDRLTEEEVKAVIRLWSERQRKPEKPLDSRPTVIDVAAALDVPAEQVTELLTSIRNERVAAEHRKNTAAQSRAQEQARVAREKQRLEDARRKRQDAIRQKSTAPSISITPVSTVPSAKPPIAQPHAAPARSSRRQITSPYLLLAIGGLFVAVLIGWLLSPPRVVIQSSVNLAGPPVFPPPPAFAPPVTPPPAPPTQIIINGPAAPAPSARRLAVPSYRGPAYDPMAESHLRMQELRAENEHRRLESDLRMAEIRARSAQVRAEAERMRAESRALMDETMARTRSIHPFGMRSANSGP